MMRLTLEADGYEVEDAPDGLKGLELFGDGSRFDAVVLDQKMPGMDGIETLRQMLRRAPAATVIMVTAFGSIELAVDAMKAGARDFLKKPLTPALLRDACLPRCQNALNRAKTPRPVADTLPPPPIAAGSQEVWTVNGFFIRALPPADASSDNEHRFLVRHAGRGPQGEVLVTISAAEVSRICQAQRTSVATGQSFLAAAGRASADEPHVPPRRATAWKSPGRRTARGRSGSTGSRVEPSLITLVTRY